MKSYKSWKINEAAYAYTQSIDGPPLHPHTIAGAEVQIRTLAMNIRTTFKLDEKFAQFHEQIMKATTLLEQAADTIGQGDMSGEARNTAHKFHTPTN